MTIVTTAGSIRPNLANTPTREGSVIDTISDIENIELAYEGVIVYVKDTQKLYKITSMRPDSSGRVGMEVNTYEEIEPFCYRQDILDSDWIEIEPDGMYQIQITHQLDSEAITIALIDYASRKSLLEIYEILSPNQILLKNDEAVRCLLTVSKM